MILNEIYERLELADDCLVRLSDPNWKNKVSFPSRIYRLLETNDLLKDMDAFFCFDNKPLILFFKEPKDKQALHRAIWNFNESPIAVIIENNAVEIYNGFIFNKTKKLLEHLGGKEYLNDFVYNITSYLDGKSFGDKLLLDLTKKFITYIIRYNLI